MAWRPRSRGPRPPGRRPDGRAAPGAGSRSGAAPAPIGRLGGIRRRSVRNGNGRALAPAGGDPADQIGRGAFYREIELAAIRPNPQQPRTQFDDERLAELEHSIREFGLLQPIVVREASPGAYELVMGERRWRAAQRAGLTRLPAIVRRTSDDAMLRDALLENIHRVQLNPLDEAAAYEQLLAEFGVTHDRARRPVGRSRPVVTNTIRLLSCRYRCSAASRRECSPPARSRAARAGRRGAAGGARRGSWPRVCPSAPRRKPSCSCGGRLPRAKPTRRKTMQAPGIQDLADRLSDTFDTRVKVELGQRKGRIVVEFGSVEDLERIAKLMDRPTEE